MGLFDVFKRGGSSESPASKMPAASAEDSEAIHHEVEAAPAPMEHLDGDMGTEMPAADGETTPAEAAEAPATPEPATPEPGTPGGDSAE